MRENVPLAPLCTLGVGGPARYLLDVHADLETARRALQWAREEKLPLFVLGGGSNLVVSDEGFPGLVLRAALRSRRLIRQANGIAITLGAGEIWDDIVEWSVAERLSGIECLSGIPGSAGATPIQNLGAYGQQVGDTLIEVEALDLRDGSLVSFHADECGLGYRMSRFKAMDKGRYLILAVRLLLHEQQPARLRHEELARMLHDGGTDSPTPRDVRNAVMTLRRRKSMVLDDADANSRSVGSFFVNPIVTTDVFESVRNAVRRESRAASESGPPAHELADGLVKISAAWLIERAGFPRGFRRRRVGLSQRHALAIVNRGGATARDVMTLARDIRNAVLSRFGIRLAIEPELLGVALD
ncbi:MAG: UDP-N-acetylmuramate dehydrogenase [Vicinamibacteria bacterium]|nr:UDP-N-acetylmuramate dehydrogenase [Vicinamibacteria bacterium]